MVAANRRRSSGGSMKMGRFIARLPYSVVGALVVVGLCPAGAFAQDAHAHATADPNKAGALVKIVREATERFRDVAVAEAEGYGLQFGCVTGPDFGAMGMHFVNFPLVFDGELDPRRPEIVIYEPLPDGRVRLIGADYLVLADQWNAKHAEPPQLMGQLLQFFETPNRFNLPAFYTLHVSAWKVNANGTFVNWHTKESCDAFSPRH